MSTLTARRLADALGVSESSLKRWADDGRIPASRTEGGHRRIRVEDALQFIRSRRLPLVRPELLGLMEAPDDEALIELLVSAAPAATTAALTRFVRGDGIAALGDGPIRRALERVGAGWQHDADGVYLEHRTTVLCGEVVARLRAMLAEPPPGRPVAVGAAAPGDPYTLPTALCAAVLAEVGLATVNLGADCPTQALLRAAQRERAALVWVSVSAPPTSTTLAALAAVEHDLAAAGVRLVVGGRAASSLAGVVQTAPVPDLEQLAALGRSVLTRDHVGA
ncbi:MAG: helix-turn-helix domain-containing protein [Kofleriaceae bacterium]|jgi:excisionase family DNA binding protein|nr:helix-turn-helix domain-containing protein [Kofleriaceae bacterium]MBP6835956.1 helix-turn-helix domain-containing protein [Kofleriaceae bacterium]MBP9205934.1 helix-turn-helix domain-containing protein [Kofleriaceae bacterium]